MDKEVQLTMTTPPNIRPSDPISYRCPITQQWKLAIVSYCESWGVVAVADSMPFQLEWHEIHPPF